MKLILDTNAYVAFKLGYTELTEYLVQAHSIFISPVMLGELMFGFRAGGRFDKNMAELNRFLAHPVVEVLQLTEITSDRYGRIAAGLKKNGTPIPANHIWIAAQIMESGAELVTMDYHFKMIDGLVYRLFKNPQAS